MAELFNLSSPLSLVKPWHSYASDDWAVRNVSRWKIVMLTVIMGTSDQTGNRNKQLPVQNWNPQHQSYGRSLIWHKHTQKALVFFCSLSHHKAIKCKDFLYVWKWEIKGARGDNTARPVLASHASFREDQTSVSVELRHYSATYLCMENLKRQHSVWSHTNQIYVMATSNTQCTTQTGATSRMCENHKR